MPKPKIAAVPIADDASVLDEALTDEPTGSPSPSSPSTTKKRKKRRDISLPGASASAGYKFEDEEIVALAESPQLVRWGGLANDHVEWLAKDIAARGQQTPVLVRLAANGKPELVAGRHRRAAIMRINENPSEYGLPGTIPLTAVYKELTDEEAIRASFAENTARPLSCMDLAHTAAQLSRLDWGNKEIAATLTTAHHRVSASRVSQLRSLIRLPHRVQRSLHLGTLPESTARAMLRLELDAETMEEMANQLESGEIKAGDITALANDARRKAGKQIRRGMYEFKTKLEEIGSSKAMDLIAWLDGELKTDKRVEEIFAEDD